MHSLQDKGSSDDTTKKVNHLDKNFLISKIINQGHNVSLKAIDIPKHVTKRCKGEKKI